MKRENQKFGGLFGDKKNKTKENKDAPVDDHDMNDRYLALIAFSGFEHIQQWLINMQKLMKLNLIKFI